MERDIHGCASNGTVWGTPEFQELRLLDKIYSRDISALLDLEYPIGKDKLLHACCHHKYMKQYQLPVRGDSVLTSTCRDSNRNRSYRSN